MFAITLSAFLSIFRHAPYEPGVHLPWCNPRRRGGRTQCGGEGCLGRNACGEGGLCVAARSRWDVPSLETRGSSASLRSDAVITLLRRGSNCPSQMNRNGMGSHPSQGRSAPRRICPNAERPYVRHSGENADSQNTSVAPNSGGWATTKQIHKSVHKYAFNGISNTYSRICSTSGSSRSWPYLTQTRMLTSELFAPIARRLRCSVTRQYDVVHQSWMHGNCVTGLDLSHSATGLVSANCEY